MDLITQTSLEALLLKATNPQNQNIDAAAIEAFCALVNKEKDGAFIGVKVIANRLPSGNEKETLQTLSILDTCMSRCGTNFQNEVGKFRFLNEMIKLVSPKYLGSHTPLAVKQKVLQLMYLWTLDYPKETKIKEAYDMLRKQGVVKEIPNPNINMDPPIDLRRKTTNSIFYDEEKSKILQKLLQSKDPEDIQAANWLIKSMVKEDDKRAEMKSRRITELESVQNNVRLLNEMLDSYKLESSSHDELDLIKELHQSCERLRPNIVKLAAETQQNEEILSDVLQINDELSQVFAKFNTIVMKGEKPFENGQDNSVSLLDLDNTFINSGATSRPVDAKSDIDVLCDIFTASNIPDSAEVLLPTTILHCDKKENKHKGLEELDALSETLLKANLQSIGQKILDKNPIKIQETDNLLKKSEESPAFQNNDKNENLVNLQVANTKDKNEEMKLNDILIKLEDIKPGSIQPITILDDKLSITLHLAKDKPRGDVYVFVITTISKYESPLNNYLFQPVVPKGCKLKLQPPSMTELPKYNPFLPPSAITQIMLIAKPKEIRLTLKFVVSFMMDDETITEMGEVNNLSL